MALKSKLSPEEYARLNPALKTEYKQDGDAYVLDVEGAEDVGALKRAKERETEAARLAREEAKEAKRKLKEKEDAEAAAETERAENSAKKKGDMVALEESYKAKLAKQDADAKARIDAAQANLRKLLVDNVASSLASEISVSPELMLPHIKSRITAEEVNGEMVTRILDKDGKPSALTVDELKQEFVANEKFSAVVRASNASGGGANGAKPPGGAGGGKAVVFAGKSAKDIAAQLKTSGKLRDRGGKAGDDE